MNQHLFKAFSVFVLVLVAQNSAFAQTQTSTLPIQESVRGRGYFNFYSENSYYYEYDVFTDSRLRYYQPLMEQDNFKFSTYIGTGFQYQAPGAREKYFDNSVSPHLGLQTELTPYLKLQTHLQYRIVMGTDGQSSSTQWDPRAVLSGGHLWTWPVIAIFTDVYGESCYVRRLSNHPVTTLQAKQGYRWLPNPRVYIDAYGEYYVRDSRSDDLGASMSEVRIGGRSQWSIDRWNVAANIYHPFQKHDTTAEIEGVLTVGGNF